MKSLLQNLGIILVILSALMLIGTSFTSAVNSNVCLGGSLCVGIVGLLLHIYLNKKVVD